jgi:hypothetical protein
MPWIVIERVTLPLAVFFHFHSAVVCSQLFKEVYAVKEDEEERSDDHVEVKLNLRIKYIFFEVFSCYKVGSIDLNGYMKIYLVCLFKLTRY